MRPPGLAVGWGVPGAPAGLSRGGSSSSGSCSGSTGPGENEAKDLVYDLTRKFVTRFAERCGSISCTELLGCGLSTDEGLARARDENLTRTLCPCYVEDAVEMILEEVLASAIISRQSTTR